MLFHVVRLSVLWGWQTSERGRKNQPSHLNEYSTCQEKQNSTKFSVESTSMWKVFLHNANRTEYEYTDAFLNQWMLLARDGEFPSWIKWTVSLLPWQCWPEVAVFTVFTCHTLTISTLSIIDDLPCSTNRIRNSRNKLFFFRFVIECIGDVFFPYRNALCVRLHWNRVCSCAPVYSIWTGTLRRSVARVRLVPSPSLFSSQKFNYNCC